MTDTDILMHLDLSACGVYAPNTKRYNTRLMIAVVAVPLLCTKKYLYETNTAFLQVH